MASGVKAKERRAHVDSGYAMDTRAVAADAENGRTDRGLGSVDRQRLSVLCLHQRKRRGSGKEGKVA